MTTLQMRPATGSFWKRFTPLFSAGLLGIGALLAAQAPQLSATLAALPEAPPIPLAGVLALAAAQSAVLLGAAVAIGVALAPGLRLRSHSVVRAETGAPLLPALRRELPLAAALGAITGLITVALDLALRPVMPPLKATGAATAEALAHTNLPSILAALLYGGITEELLMRFGLLTLCASIGVRLLRPAGGAPGAAVMWAAIGLTALLFGLGHLPVTASLYPLTPVVIGRAIALNGLGGLIFGWLYWRRSLEAAMIAHFTAHIVLTIINLAALVVN